MTFSYITLMAPSESTSSSDPPLWSSMLVTFFPTLFIGLLFIPLIRYLKRTREIAGENKRLNERQADELHRIRLALEAIAQHQTGRAPHAPDA